MALLVWPSHSVNKIYDHFQWAGMWLVCHCSCVGSQAGGYSTASALYKESLQVLQQSDTPLEEQAIKMEKVIQFL